jgi:hypothetical protein
MAYENNSWYKPGAWNVICDVCGFRLKSTDVRKRWDGLMVCHVDYETDHPQKYLRVREDKQAVPFTRKPVDAFVDICYLWGLSAYADLASADCAKADNTTYQYLFLFNLKNAGVTT